MKEKIYIAGCGGMLGEAFYQIFIDEYDLKCTDKDVNASWLSYCDFRDFKNYEKDIVEFKPDYLFHIGAYTDLEWCENNVEDTYLNNCLAVENAVRIANELNIPILYISTAGIFDGSKDYFDEFDIPNPQDVYARAKWGGEQYVINNAKQYLVCRAGWMMGGGPNKDKKFIQKIMKQLKDGKDTLYIVNDKNGTPTYTYDFANTVKELLKHRYWGMFEHFLISAIEYFGYSIQSFNQLGFVGVLTNNELGDSTLNYIHHYKENEVILENKLYHPIK